MRDDDRLTNIIRYCEEIQEDRERFGDSLEDFIEDSSYQRSCCMNLLQIGETVRKLSYELTEQYNDVDWISVINFRNFVVHRYEHLNDTKTWEIITKDVPELKSICEKILAEISGS